MGFPGEQQRLVVYNRFKGDDIRNEGGPGGLPGNYVVSFLLSRPGFAPTSEGQISFTHALAGDSHVRLFKRRADRNPADADRIELHTASREGLFVFKGEGNDEGFLGKLSTNPFYASSVNDAEKKAHDAVAPLLSHWSIVLDVPLNVEAMETTEIRTAHSTLRFVAPNLEMDFRPAQAPDPLNDDYCHYASLYKEALNSNSPYYRYLCFFKVAEGIKERIDARARRAAQSGTTPRLPTLTVPCERPEMLKWLNDIYPWRTSWDDMSLDQAFPIEVRGRKVNGLLNGPLNTLRVGIAHAILKSGEVRVSVDNLEHQREVNKWLPVIRCIARQLIRHEFSMEFK